MTLSFPSSGNLLLPMTAPRRALAGLPHLLRAPRHNSGFGALPPRIPNPVSRFPRRGLGVGSAAGVEAGAVITSVAAATGPAAPIVAAVGTLVSLISSFIGGGCGQACIASAQAEQVYEVACMDLTAVAKLGMLSSNDYLTGVQNFISGGNAHLQQLQQQGDARAADGLKNFDNATSGDAAFAATLPATAPTPLDLAQAQAAFISPGASGWYSQSVTPGNQLALAYLQALQTAQASQTSSVGIDATTGTISLPGISISPSTGTVAVLGSTFSFTEILIFGGLAWAAWKVVG